MVERSCKMGEILTCNKSPMINQRLTQYSIGKDRLDKGSEDECMTPPAAEPAPAPESSRKEKAVRQKYGECQNVLLSAMA